MTVDAVVDRLGGDPGYIRFLLVERPKIRSALEARGMTLDDEGRTLAYPTTIGNAFHNDVIELEMWLTTLSEGDRALLQRWAENESCRPVFGRAKMRRVGRLLREFGSAQEPDK